MNDQSRIVDLSSSSIPGKCSFCGRSAAEAKLLIAGQDAHICETCVKDCAQAVRAKVGDGQFRLTYELLESHFQGTPPEAVTTSSRLFPKRLRVDLQKALEASCLRDARKVVGIHTSHQHDSLHFSDLLERGNRARAIAPLQYEEVDVGDAMPIKCLVNALVLLENAETPVAILVAQHNDYMGGGGITVEVATLLGTAGAAIARDLFVRLEEAVEAAQSYRGKVLSLEHHPRFSGVANGITVHKLRAVAKDQVILPKTTLDQLNKNIVQFARLRLKLRSLGMSSKKGLLFYGPPGTGKTHTVHYLASCLPDHTTLLVTAEQVGLLPEYFRLARLLQPSILVIEDVDLIARDRTTMDSPCEEVLLNQLLNEMDGLREDADTFFILTTNRPETLEAALAQRPGRIDQAIEFPLPDKAGRERLVDLYAGKLTVPARLREKIVKQTEGVSASFIKELMRRTAQYSLKSGKGKALAMTHVNAALEEMLFVGGALNAKLLGGSASTARAE
jgi:hypothetical protein